MQWGPDVDAKLFMYVLKIHNVKLDYQALAMAMGNDVTPKAITHRIARLRLMAAEHETTTASHSPKVGLPGAAKRAPRHNVGTKAPPVLRATTAEEVATKKIGTSTTHLGPGAGTKRKAIETPLTTMKTANKDYFTDRGSYIAGDAEEGAEAKEEGSMEEELPVKKNKSKNGNERAVEGIRVYEEQPTGKTYTEAQYA